MDLISEKQKIWNANWRRKNREHLREYSKLYILLHRQELRLKWLRREAVKQMEEFGVVRPKVTKCWICKKVIRGRQLHIDHDHKTGRFRGWLCAKHNLLIGLLEKDRRNIRKMLKWIRFE